MTVRHLGISALLFPAVALGALACGVPREAGSSEPPVAAPAASARAHYLANAGVLVVDGGTRIAFDPLFRNDYGRFELVPEDMERALFAGEPPFDGLDAVFVSHYHEDHFSPKDLLRLLEEQPTLELYAPEQAVAGMREVATDVQNGIFGRITAISLEQGDAPVTFEKRSLRVEVVRVPHSGWPERMADVENLAFRVTLGDETSVVHLGDADAKDVHFARDAGYWRRRQADVAFPPYWFLQSEEGRGVLEHRIAPVQAIGVHVPVAVPSRPEDRDPELRGLDLFTEPGEVRDIP